MIQYTSSSLKFGLPAQYPHKMHMAYTDTSKSYNPRAFAFQPKTPRRDEFQQTARLPISDPMTTSNTARRLAMGSARWMSLMYGAA